MKSNQPQTVSTGFLTEGGAGCIFPGVVCCGGDNRVVFEAVILDAGAMGKTK